MKSWRELFSESGVSNEKLRWWLSDRLDLPLTALPLSEPPSPADLKAFRIAADRLRAGEPVQYVCGRAPFRGLELLVDPRVLIPRPETEQLVQIALDRGIPDGNRVLDVCTGSGCIALALKSERPDLIVEGTDLLPDALEVARENAVRLKLDVSFRQADLLAEEPAAAWDLLLSNPPYIAEEERAALPPEVRDHEPATALFADDHGTALIRRLMDQARRVLTPGGALLLETGETQRPLLDTHATQTGWHIQHLPDLAGRDRFRLLTRP